MKKKTYRVIVKGSTIRSNLNSMQAWQLVDKLYYSNAIALHSDADIELENKEDFHPDGFTLIDARTGKRVKGAESWGSALMQQHKINTGEIVRIDN